MKGDLFNFKPSVISLVLTNLVLMILAAVLEWRTYDMVMVFWCENLVIGIYTAIKLPMCQPVKAENLDHFPVPQKGIKFFIVPVFLLLILIFAALHLAMIHMLFRADVEYYAETHKTFAFPEINRTALLIAIGVLMLNHGISFVANFLKKKEYKRITIDEMIVIPFKRLIIVHLVVLGLGLGVGVAQVNTVTMVIVFFIGKTWIDYRRHSKEHTDDPDSIYGWF